MEGETSSIECAHQLGRLCENRHLVVNLIPYNATDVKDKLQCPSNERMKEFRDIVASYGTFCTIRRTMGADIASACGQLVQKTQEEESGIKRPGDIEDVVSGTRNAKEQSPDEIPRTDRIAAVETGFLRDVSSDQLDRYAQILGTAALVSASCFIASAAASMNKRR